MTTDNLAYPDLDNPQYVFDALLGHGMFSDKLPPCFDSSTFLSYINNNHNVFDLQPKKKQNRNYVKFSSIGHTHVPREMGVPHPYTYFLLCKHIKEHWEEINKHIGLSGEKINYCHVRKIDGKPYIFEMNYQSGDIYIQEGLEIEYKLDARYIVTADISKCFPSIYSHSLPWAICTKKAAKNNRNSKEWFNKLDVKVRNLSDEQTIGLIIGPHASNIISEIILSAVDSKLLEYGFKKIIRNIDDYRYYASSEEDAIKFITTLRRELQQFELSLNDKKTSINKLPLANRHWIDQLRCFSFPTTSRETIGFTSIGNYLRLSEYLAKEHQTGAPIKYAIKTIRELKLSVRAKRLFIDSLFEMSIKLPYLFPLLEETIEEMSPDLLKEPNVKLNNFLNLIFLDSLIKKQASCLSFVFYLSVKYDYLIKISEEQSQEILEIKDCICLLLYYFYCRKNNQEDICNKLIQIAQEKNNVDKNDTNKGGRDAFWLLSYELLDVDKLEDPTLKILKEASISFLNLEKVQEQKTLAEIVD